MQSFIKIASLNKGYLKERKNRFFRTNENKQRVVFQARQEFFNALLICINHRDERDQTATEICDEGAVSCLGNFLSSLKLVKKPKILLLISCNPEAGGNKCPF